MRDIQAAIEDRVHLYFWGRATYEDMFEGSEPHFIEFCYRLDVSGATPDKITLMFTHYGAHNRSDEDSGGSRKTPSRAGLRRIAQQRRRRRCR